MNFCTWTAIEGVSGFGAGAGAGLLVVPELADVAPHGRVADDDVAGNPGGVGKEKGGRGSLMSESGDSTVTGFTWPST